jgi:hypothetical protein
MTVSPVRATPRGGKTPFPDLRHLVSRAHLRLVFAHRPVDDARSHGRFGSGCPHHRAGASMSGSVQSTANDARLASTAGRARSVEHPDRMASESAATVRRVLIADRMTAGTASVVPSVTRAVRPRLPRI